MIAYGRQDIDQTDIDAVVAVLRSDFLTQGPAVPAFEAAVAGRCGALHAIAVNSATSALHLACLALSVGPGDRVWTTPITFVASANCALYCGAEIDFVDIDPVSCNMSVPCLAEKLTRARAANKLPKVVIPVHLAGKPCDMAGIQALSRQYGFRIVVDASHAIGASYCGEAVGNCRYSDITVFSFHPVKIITTGEGGIALSNDATLAQRMRLLRSHGIARAAEDMTQAPDGPWYYEQIALGYNYRMTDIQAALGLSQMHRLDEFVRSRESIAQRYDRQLTGLPLSTPAAAPPGNASAWHLYVVRLQRDRMQRTHRQVFESLRAQGIGVGLHYIPVYHQPYFARMGFVKGHCPEAERYYAEAISLPIYPALTPTQQEQVVSALAKAIS